MSDVFNTSSLPSDLINRKIEVQVHITPWNSQKAYFWVCRDHSELLTTDEFKTYCPKSAFDAFESRDCHWWQLKEYYWLQKVVNWDERNLDSGWLKWMLSVLDRVSTVGQKKTKQASLESF